jgi:hypothetical protein
MRQAGRCLDLCQRETVVRFFHREFPQFSSRPAGVNSKLSQLSSVLQTCRRVWRERASFSAGSLYVHI